MAGIGEHCRQPHPHPSRSKYSNLHVLFSSRPSRLRSLHKRCVIGEDESRLAKNWVTKREVARRPGIRFGVMIFRGSGRRSIWSKDEKAGFRRLLSDVL